MHTAFEMIHNHRERLVFDAVLAKAEAVGCLEDTNMVADIACLALNHIRPRYIRHQADMAFYQTYAERQSAEQEVATAVEQAFEIIANKQAQDESQSD